MALTIRLNFETAQAMLSGSYTNVMIYLNPYILFWFYFPFIYFS